MALEDQIIFSKAVQIPKLLKTILTGFIDSKSKYKIETCQNSSNRIENVLRGFLRVETWQKCQKVAI